LIANGVKRGTLVALYMNKSIEMILSILATHKAGGGYVPLDPEYPSERTRTIISLAQVPVVLTSQELHKQLVLVLTNTSIISLLVDFRELSPSTKPDIGPTDRDDICHVLFTSRSTGSLKGIELDVSDSKEAIDMIYIRCGPHARSHY
jgi:non-ribosomal peptide synthetase component F